jgi:hypothetical protein
MDLRKVTYEYRLKNWTQMISECNQSGLTVKAWCKENNIKTTSYYYWLKRIRIAACNSMSTVSEKPQQLVPLNIADMPEYTSTEVNSSQNQSPQTAIILKINSVVIEIKNGASDNTIENTLRAISRLC